MLGVVAYVWGGFGAAFGPVVLFALFSRRTTRLSALSGMVTGTLVLVFRKHLGLGEYLYELLPGFLANVSAMLLVNRLQPQDNEEILREYDEVWKEIRDITQKK